jgi:hypothetical protein
MREFPHTPRNDALFGARLLPVQEQTQLLEE